MSAEHFDHTYDRPEPLPVGGCGADLPAAVDHTVYRPFKRPADPAGQLLPNGSVAVPQGSRLDPSVAASIQKAVPWDGGKANLAQSRRQQFRESLRLELSDRISYLRRQRQDFEESVKIVQAQQDRLQLILEDLGL